MTTFGSFSRTLAALTAISFVLGCGGKNSNNTTTTPPAAISVSVTPGTATLSANGTQTFAATVANDSSNAGVTWTASTGTITTAGVYTAPATIATAGTATITATSKADTSKSGTATVTLSVTPTFTVSGQITPSIGCSSAGLNGVTVSINTTPVQTTTTSSNGNFSFSNVPNGTYSVTPSMTGATAVFYPTASSITVSGANPGPLAIGGAIGYSVAGTVAYTGSKTGRIYLALYPVGCSSTGTVGTSIAGPGAFTIRGVPPGSYTLQAFLDPQGNASTNAADPTGVTSAITVNGNLTGTNVTLTDPAAVTLTAGPTLLSISPFNTGAMAQFKPVTNSSGVETASSYTLQWSTDPSFATVTGSKTFAAIGTRQPLWFVHGLTDGAVLYFRAFATSGGTATSAYSATIGPVTIGAPPTANTVTGAVTFSGTATGPLYVGMFNQITGIFYGQYIANPVSAQAYSVQVPNGNLYQVVALVDQNNDGIVDAGDLDNITSGSGSLTGTVSGNLSNLNLTLPSANAIIFTNTVNFKSVTSAGTKQNYSVNLQVFGLNKVPVAISLASNANSSGANLIAPLDVALCTGATNSCSQGFRLLANLGPTSPAANDTYTFNVTYSDGTTGTLTATVTGVSSAFATNLAPTTGTSVSTTPTFTWSDPASPSNYVYQFLMTDASGNIIWRIPGPNSSSNGLNSNVTSLTWGVDPTDAANVPSVSALSTTTNYLWQIQVLDANGNSTVTQVQYQP